MTRLSSSLDELIEKDKHTMLLRKMSVMVDQITVKLNDELTVYRKDDGCFVQYIRTKMDFVKGKANEDIAFNLDFIKNLLSEHELDICLKNAESIYHHYVGNAKAELVKLSADERCTNNDSVAVAVSNVPFIRCFFCKDEARSCNKHGLIVCSNDTCQFPVCIECSSDPDIETGMCVNCYNDGQRSSQPVYYAEHNEKPVGDRYRAYVNRVESMNIVRINVGKIERLGIQNYCFWITGNSNLAPKTEVVRPYMGGRNVRSTRPVVRPSSTAKKRKSSSSRDRGLRLTAVPSQFHLVPEAQDMTFRSETAKNNYFENPKKKDGDEVEDYYKRIMFQFLTYLDDHPKLLPIRFNMCLRRLMWSKTSFRAKISSNALRKKKKDPFQFLCLWNKCGYYSEDNCDYPCGCCHHSFHLGAITCKKALIQMAFCQLTHSNEPTPVESKQKPSVAFKWNTAYSTLNIFDPMVKPTKEALVQLTTNTLQNHLKNTHPSLELPVAVLNRKQLKQKVSNETYITLEYKSFLDANDGDEGDLDGSTNATKLEFIATLPNHMRTVDHKIKGFEDRQYAIVTNDGEIDDLESGSVTGNAIVANEGEMDDLESKSHSANSIVAD